RRVLGMIADFLSVRREYAPLIDLALGDWSQRFLVRDVDDLAEALRQRGQPFSGRVSFLPLRGSWRATADEAADGRPAPTAARPNRLTEASLLGRVRMPLSAEGTPAHPGVGAPADQLATCQHPEPADLPARPPGPTLTGRD